ncbi:MAG: MFS transporter [Armatimonadota bacterium]|jgi:FSR family fosmidomycin resistance protein-like MFS transporter
MWRLGALIYGHLAGDAFMGFVPALLTLVAVRFGLSHTGLGGLGMVGALTASFTQPLWGHLADRRPALRFWAYGPLVCAVGICLIGRAPTPAIVACCLLVGGLGNAAFHPGAASAATAVGGRERGGLAMSVFGAGGILGYAIGPWAATALWSRLGPERLWQCAWPAALAAGVLLVAGRGGAIGAMRAQAADAARRAVHRRGVSLLFVIVTLRAATAISLGTFLPRLLEEQGGRHLIGPYMLVLTGSGGIAAVFGGTMSDRIGRQPVTAISLLLAGPALWCFFHIHSVPVLLLAVTGMCLQGAAPANIVHMQALMPGGRSLAASLSMGVAWGLGGLANLVIGRLADAPAIGLVKALEFVVIVPVVAGALALLPAAGAGEADRLAERRRNNASAR